MTLFQRIAAFAILLTSLAANAQTPRGPSTAEERARVTELAAKAQKDPLAVRAANEAWFEEWISGVPDITFMPEAVARWCVKNARGDLRKVVQFQFGASAVAQQIKLGVFEPKLPADINAINLAGLEGVLAAYETLLAQNPKNRAPKMDEAVASRNEGRLAAFANAIAQ